MRYYSEEGMKSLRLGFEEKVLNSPQVSKKQMFGCPCYQAYGKLFAFLITDGIVITQLAQAEREALSRQYPTTAFQAGEKTVQNWTRLSVRDKEELARIMPYVRKSYESALRKEARHLHVTMAFLSANLCILRRFPVHPF